MLAAESHIGSTWWPAMKPIVGGQGLSVEFGFEVFDLHLETTIEK